MTSEYPFGPVLHAHGQVVKFHTVRYSIGLAGRYWLHVGLRQQETRLVGSPFLLEVSPGAAHARSSPLPADALPLTGLVRPLKGGEVSCELLVTLRDRMGNRCTSGGAALTVNTVINVAGEEKKKLKENETAAVTNVVSQCVDNKDGSYRLGWTSQVAGVYSVSITIDNVHLVGSPVMMTLQAGPPEIDQIQVSGDGTQQAQAGKPALVVLKCKDFFGNVASTSGSAIFFGLRLLIRDPKESKVIATDCH